MSENIENIEMDTGADILTLLDEEGAEHEFEVLDSAEFEGCNYMALVPILEEPQDLIDDIGELVILRVSEEDGEEFLETIEDEDEFNRVGDFFTARLADDFDFED